MATLKNTIVDDTGHLTLAKGTTGQRPGSPVSGMTRFNTSTSVIEYYNGVSWVGIGLLDGSSQASAASSGAAIRAINPSPADGNYWFLPPGYGSTAIQTYTVFSQAPSNRGYVQVARGRESTDWWNNNGQNTAGLVSANASDNTPVAVAPGEFVSRLSGANWNTMRMIVNRRNSNDSFLILGQTSTTFNWGYYPQSPSSVSTTITRYNSLWLAGGAAYSGTGGGWTDTLGPFVGSNDCQRTFTWNWGGHGPWQGWSGGSSCTPAGGFQNGGEGHSIQLVNCYIEC
jgi:hypothetical protein